MLACQWFLLVSQVLAAQCKSFICKSLSVRQPQANMCVLCRTYVVTAHLLDILVQFQASHCNVQQLHW